MPREGFWKGRRVLVTGANGFVGSWIAKALVEKEAQVVTLVRDLNPLGGLALHQIEGRVTRVLGSVTDYSLLERVLSQYEIDTCFHLAAQAIVGQAQSSPLSTFEANIQGTWSLLEACRRSPGLRCLIVASSDKAYGEHPSLPYTEDFGLLGSYPYDASKACADILARSYFATYGLPVAVSRCANIYGGGDLNFSRIVPDTMRSLIRNQDPVIRSDGTPVRDYLYISDAVEAYLTLAEQADSEGVKGEAFNFGTAQPVSVLELVLKIIAIAGQHHLKPRILGQKPAEIKRQYLSSEKAQRLLGWKPSYTLEEGLRETYSWYSQFFST